MQEPICQVDLAKRLANVIAADIALYNTDKIQEGFATDTLFEILAPDIEEGRQLYRSRVAPELDAALTLYHHAVVDTLFKGKGEQAACTLW